MLNLIPQSISTNGVTPPIRRLDVFLIFIFILSTPFVVSAQKAFDVTSGIGFYELTHVGVAWSYSKKSAIGLYAGTNFNYQGADRKSLGLSFVHIYTKPIIWKIQPGFSLKAQYWDQDDDNYYFNSISFLFQGVLSYSVNNNLRLVTEGGGVLNFALDTERKQNVIVGYPTRWNGNVTFSIRYRVNKKTKLS